MEFDDGSRGVVDPEVRAYVYSLVSAVSLGLRRRRTITVLTKHRSLEELARTKRADTYWEMMRLLV